MTVVVRITNPPEELDPTRLSRPREMTIDGVPSEARIGFRRWMGDVGDHKTEVLIDNVEQTDCEVWIDGVLAIKVSPEIEKFLRSL